VIEGKREYKRFGHPCGPSINLFDQLENMSYNGSCQMFDEAAAIS